MYSSKVVHCQATARSFPQVLWPGQTTSKALAKIPEQYLVLGRSKERTHSTCYIAINPKPRVPVFLPCVSPETQEAFPVAPSP